MGQSGHFLMIKRDQYINSLLNRHAPEKHRPTKFLQRLTDLKADTDSDTVVVRNLNTTLPLDGSVEQTPASLGHEDGPHRPMQGPQYQEVLQVLMCT